MIKTQNAVANEFLPRLEQKRLIFKRYAVEILALSLHPSALDQTNHEICIMRIPFVLLLHLPEAMAGKNTVMVCEDLPGDHAIDISIDFLDVLASVNGHVYASFLSASTED